MATSNLGLTIINTSDYVTPVPINDNMTKLDQVGLDYIITSTQVGEWWLRKWKSGRQECGIDFKSFGTLVMRAWGGGGYISNEVSFGAYPSSFASRPFTTISFEGDALHDTRVSGIAMKHSVSTTMSPTFVIHDADPQDMQAYCGILVTGRWK